MAINMKSSVLAIKPEVTEGTPVIPAAAGDFIALQPDAAMAPAIDVLANDELRSSIGKAKPILGMENPTFSMSHYLRHSGVAGTAPGYKQLLKAAFGSEVVASTEYNTIAASTTVLVKVDTGEGAQFQRGQVLLVKDSTNGFSLRPVLSVSNDDLTLGFALAVAPGTGVDLGKAVLYKPADSGHQSVTLWHYLGNAGALQMMAGGKVTEFAVEIAAGELVNATFSLEGLSYYFDPINITSADRYLDFTDDDGTHAAIVAAQWYKDPHELASAIQAAIVATGTTETITCVYSNTTGKFTIASSTSTVLTLKWNTGANTANTIGDKIGFSVAADDSGSTSYTSDNALSFAASYTPSYDSADPLVAKSNECLIGDATSTTCFAASNVSFTLSDARAGINSICATTGRSGSIITERSVTITATALLNQYDADKFMRFRSGQQTSFLYNGGTKTGGNWDAGKCFSIFVPTATVSSFSLTDQDGLVAMEIELQAYVDANGSGEVYLNFL